MRLSKVKSFNWKPWQSLAARRRIKNRRRSRIAIPVLERANAMQAMEFAASANLTRVFNARTTLKR
jgi:hypothetical protein